jgi:histidinol-phosphate phosphatase family protein
MEVVIVMGYPCSGKSTVAESLTRRGYAHFNRDEVGGSIADLHASLDKFLTELPENARIEGVVLDNTYPGSDARTEVVKIAAKHGHSVRCMWLQTSIEDAQVNASQRQIERYRRLLTNLDEIKRSTDPGIFPSTVLFRYRKQFKEPHPSEGFSLLERVTFVRKPYGPEHVNKALILDYDGTLRETKSGQKYPTDPDDIRILPGRREILQRYLDRGYKLLGASNQSGVHKGILTANQARELFFKTNELLGHNIDFSFCPHQSRIECYCRKPMPGMAIEFIHRYKLDPAQTIMVGDMTSDRTFARRAGIQYQDQADFFRG